MLKEKIKGAWLGAALGDGFGYPTEFMKVAEIQSTYGFNGLIEPLGYPIKVTDDTQMGIAVGKALMRAWKNNIITPTDLETSLRSEFIKWYHDPQNNRAPGMTCLGSCEKLETGIKWEAATNLNSKGCGANMRVFPVALLKFKHPSITDADIAKWAQFQAAITHAHPTALAASDLTAITLVRILEGLEPEQLLDNLVKYAESQKTIYHQEFLRDIWQRPGVENPQAFIQRGWEECIALLQRIQKVLPTADKGEDPCDYTGEGWIAEEAFATALLCFLYYPDKSVSILRRAVNTKGDSDSLACIAGGFAGAYNGIESFPKEWINRLEYQEELHEFINFII